MAIAALRYVHIYTHTSVVADVLKLLQKNDIIDIGVAEQHNYSDTANDIAQLLQWYTKRFPTDRSFVENFIKVKNIVTPAAYHEVINQKAFLKQITRYYASLIELQRLSQETAILALKEKEFARLQVFVPWVVRAQRLHTIAAYCAFVPLKKLSRFDGVYDLCGEVGGFAAIMVFGSAIEDQQVIQKLGGSIVAIPHDLDLQYQEIQKKLVQQTQQEEKLQHALTLFLQKQHVPLGVWYDHLVNEAQIERLQAQTRRSVSIAQISGWVELKRISALETILKPYKKKTAFVVEAGDNAPIKLRNGVLSPFEAVTFLYGLPNAQEYDPTPWLAPFYMLFFGLCMSDFGYGLLLLIVSAYLLIAYRNFLTMFGTRLLWLMIYCSVPTMLVGVATGSYFSLDIQTFPTYLQSLAATLKITDPIKDPLQMLMLSFVLGIVQIYVGMIIRFCLDVKQKGFKEALLVSGSWLIFIGALIGWPLAAQLTYVGWAHVFQYIFYGMMIFLVLTQGRHHKNIFMRLGSGVLSLYRLTGLLGDILSYSRLFALGLVTSVLGMVINLLSSMLQGIPLVGVILFAALMIMGHSFNFLINILGSFVHPARLQYVEYFTKFFEGGGRFWRPFTWRTEYILVKDK